MKCKPFPYSDLLAVVADGKEFAGGIADQPKSPTKYSLAVVRGRRGNIVRWGRAKTTLLTLKPHIESSKAQLINYGSSTAAFMCLNYK